ncbi:MAG: hypothetical protein US86_C0003G0044 [Candidatus Daviesbacteria bacterium GW2011_GWA2_38_24]|uniref:Uncharacterized protein n=1 Tax=Candidatus Daviesbacteria bacterium GW2011_GWA2_38_24 TaxID=1618422 RepID=A0A0G0MPH2_9BACT|nr:MAG: hypothetical protein US86_C0003G0044 [Candidatus Daviesbacteria bacterium GW2011_GWA2_38_24]KKQ80349.1 MAG: hypothetical protein UT01_C0014G0008 [Candidatus Daviesbacteria bacterium GW2011_GWA1_38_7]OGE24655.1 MAG: hypothetical protein A2688_01165 [Candidatus Daviesbacteria bacterium RIFCSPHIGHO2_01_FULL_38_8]
MDEQTFKKLLNVALEPIKKDLVEVKKAQADMKDTLDNRVLPSVTETEMTLKSYADSYKINQYNIERVDTRLTTVEKNLNIEPPEDLKVPHFSAK